MMKTNVLVSGLCVLTALTGCDAPQLPSSSDSSTATATSSDANSGAATDDTASQRVDASRDQSDQSDIPDPGDVAPVTAEGREFTANDPVRGRRSRAVGGYAGAVFGANFWARHQMVINQVKHALNLYWATNGEYPQSHEEFMEQIIKFNQIQLPELMEEQEYFYDPEEGQDGLLVRLKQTEETDDAVEADVQ